MIEVECFDTLLKIHLYSRDKSETNEIVDSLGARFESTVAQDSAQPGDAHMHSTGMDFHLVKNGSDFVLHILKRS